MKHQPHCFESFGKLQYPVVTRASHTYVGSEKASLTNLKLRHWLLTHDVEITILRSASTFHFVRRISPEHSTPLPCGCRSCLLPGINWRFQLTAGVFPVPVANQATRFFSAVLSFPVSDAPAPQAQSPRHRLGFFS